MPEPFAPTEIDGHGGVRVSRLSRLKNRKLYSPAPVPPSFPWKPRGQSTSARKHNFRDFQGSKSRNLYYPARAPPPPPRRQRPKHGHVGVRISKLSGLKMPKSVLPRLCPPAPGQKKTRARARGSTIFETFKAQNAEICTPPRPSPPALSRSRNLYSPAPVPPSFLDPQRPRARGSTIFETFKEMPKSVLPRARAPPPLHGQKMTKERPEHGRGGVRFSRLSNAQNAEICTPPRPCPPPPGPQRPKHGHVGVRNSKLSGLKMPKSVLPRARAPPPLNKREARARTRGSTIFETFKAQNAEICTPVPPAAWTPEAKARARGNFENFQGSKCRNLRLCPPAPGQKRGQSTGAGEYDFRDQNAARDPPPPGPQNQSTGTWEYEFRNFQGSKCRNLYSPAPVPPRPWTKERPEHGRGGVRFSRLSTLKMPKSVLPRARAPAAWTPCRDQSTGTREYEFRNFQGSKCRNLYSPAPVPPRPWAKERPEHGHGFSRLSRLNAEICTPPRPCPPAAWTPEAKARARGSTKLSGLKMPKSVLPRTRAPPAPGQKRGQSTGAGECEFRDEKGSKCRNLYSHAPVAPRGRGVRFSRLSTLKMQKSVLPRHVRVRISKLSGLKMPKSVLPPRPCPPPLGKREARARARGSTIFETFRAQNAEICTPPRPCPPPPGPQRPKHGEYEAFKSQNAEICTPPHPCPPAPGQKRGQSTGAGEYEFRDFHFSKCRNLYSPAPVATRPWTKERPEHGRGGVRFSRLSTLKMPKSVLPRARAPRRPQRPKHGHVGVRTHGPHASLEKLSHHVIHIYAGATARPSGNTGATRP